MSNRIYSLGLEAGGVVFPSAAQPLRNKAGEIIAGVSMMRMGGSRMYEVGALQKQAEVAPGIPGVVQWLEDAGKGVLLLFGLFVTVAALMPGDKRK